MSDDSGTEDHPEQGWVVGVGQAVGERIASLQGIWVFPGQFLLVQTVTRNRRKNGPSFVPSIYGGPGIGPGVM